MMKTLHVTVILALLATGCGGPAASGPVEPAWDRDACEHCRMAVSDRHFATQVRSALDGKVRHFDDPGCAALHGVAADDEVWVRDQAGERWLDGRKVRFSTGHTTPMGYGYGTTVEDTTVEEPGSLDWATLVAQVQERERERRNHSGH